MLMRWHFKLNILFTSKQSSLRNCCLRSPGAVGLVTHTSQRPVEVLVLMDPLTALGLASAILQIVDFSSKLVSGAVEAYSSASGTTVEFEDSERVTESLKDLTRQLNVRTTGAPLSAEDRRILEMKQGCQDLSRDIQDIVKSTKSKQPGSKRASFLVSWKTLKHRGKLKMLEQRLDRYRSQIRDYLLATMRYGTPRTGWMCVDREDPTDMTNHMGSDDLSSTNQFLEALTQEQVQGSQATRAEIRQLKSDIITAIRDAQAGRGGDTNVSPDALQLLSAVQQSLANLAKATQTVTQEDVILQRLWFAELGGRERTIEMPHEQTFRWLLYDSDRNIPSTGSTRSFDLDSDSDQNLAFDEENDHMSFHTAPDRRMDDSQVSEHTTPEVPEECGQGRDQKRESFIRWLRTENGIFYCSGKAGSGKSTLMKFLARNKKTLDELSVWSQSQGKTLIFVHFFFWSSGTKLQKSLEGLYRSILWEVLRQCPGLTPEVFPAAWSSKGDGNAQMKHQPFRMDEMETAMDLLFCGKAITSKYRLCLFVDGLDEYEGDYWKFAKAISLWAAASRDVKFCLSSRPDGAFMRHFALDEDRHLKLHELTRDDIHRFVSDQFRQDERYTAMKEELRDEFDFLGAIVDRSDGVFLWVRLVAVELLRGMGDNCSIPQLKKRLDSLPTGLEGMFHLMLDSIHRTEQKRAAQMFLTMTTDTAGVSNCVFVQAVLDDLADNPGLASTLLSGSIGPHLTQAECIQKCQTAGHRAIARCKGLIEMARSYNGIFPSCHYFKFLHRTLFDFFREPDIQSRLRSTAGQFCPHRSLAQAILACFKFFGPGGIPDRCPSYEPQRPLRPPSSASRASSRSSASDIRTLNTVRHDMIFSFLDLIHEADSDGVSPLLAEVDSMVSMFQQTADLYYDGSLPFDGLLAFGLHHPDHRDFYFKFVPSRQMVSVVVTLIVNFTRTTETTLGMVSRHQDLLKPYPGTPDIFLSAALTDLRDAFFFGKDITRTQPLIEQASPTINADCSEKCKIKDIEEHYGNFRTLAPPWTTWTSFLLALSQVMRRGKPESPSNQTGISKLIDLFLEHGAQPSVTFIGYNFSPNPPADDMAPTQPKGPFYMDLLSMMKLWRLVPTASTRQILSGASRNQNRDWIRQSLGWIPWRRRQTEKAYEIRLPVHESDKACGDFVPLRIISPDTEASTSLEDLQETVEWISRRGSARLNTVVYV